MQYNFYIVLQIYCPSFNSDIVFSLSILCRSKLASKRKREIIADAKGYNLRSKKVRVTGDSPYVFTRPYNKKCYFAKLPTEIILKVFSFISYEELGTNVRLVSKQFKVLAEDIMNLFCKNLESKIDNIKTNISISITHTRDDMELRCFCKLLNGIEYLQLHYTILYATVWRYAWNIYYNPGIEVCVYSGKILDAFKKIILLFLHQPEQIYGPSIVSDYALAHELTTIGQLIRSFCNHFDRIIELPVNSNMFCSGCKLIDILDCDIEAEKEVLEMRIEENYLTYKVKYFFSNSWIIVLETNGDRTRHWNEKIRLMYMRLKRIVVSHAEMQMDYSQYKREVNFTNEATSRLKRPLNAVYTGYGEVGRMFYYYGTMNHGSYMSKFDASSSLLMADPDENDNEDDSCDFLGFNMEIELNCPLFLAPLKLLRTLDVEGDMLCRCYQGCFYMKIQFDCPGAKYSRLPSSYTMEIKNNYH